MNILIIFTTRNWPMRSSQASHLWSFKRYIKNANCFYVNICVGFYPNYLKKIKFDLIIFTHPFLGERMERDKFREMIECLKFLKSDSAIKICMPQDEFTSMDILCEFIEEIGISFVFSVAPECEWPKIYKKVNREKVRFVRSLTGYLDEKTVNYWSKKNTVSNRRTLEIGYRTVATAVWGRFNLMKALIAEVFLKETTARQLPVDIKVGVEHFKMGDDWLDFLAQCRYTLGIEGGSRILDWDGSILQAVSSYLKDKPDATFEELAASCVPIEREGEINVVAISPRHLEACMTRTGQILVEGEYNGILKPNIHYIPLKSDFSNINEVFERMNDESSRLRMVENAYQDIIKSKKYSYSGMVQKVLDNAIPEKKDFERTGGSSTMSLLFFIYNRTLLYFNISFVFLWSRIRDLRNWIIQ
tara:strand:+ start:449 stop:1696 length:1248 start_codon:yes stop_codon:yes gene_type:complete